MITKVVKHFFSVLNFIYKLHVLLSFKRRKNEL